MSLINEALKRAREEAARREAAEKGLPLATPGPVRDRGRWLTLAVVALEAALLVSLALLFNLSARLPVGPPPVVESALDPKPPPGPVEKIPPDDPGQGQDGDDQMAAVSLEPSSPDPQASILAREESSPQEAEPALRPPPRKGPATSGEVESAPANQASDQPREFIGQAQMSGGELVDLEGIAWSETEPFALLNGQVVGVGEFIRSYRVLEIHQDRVLLQEGEDEVLLRLK